MREAKAMVIGRPWCADSRPFCYKDGVRHILSVIERRPSLLTMQTTLLLSIVSFALAVLPTRCQIKIVHTNDDGWAVANIRAQNTALRNARFNVSKFQTL